jgi:hypothetical protein
LLMMEEEEEEEEELELLSCISLYNTTKIII